MPTERRTPAQRRGSAAEQAALDRLLAAGLEPLDRNFRCKVGEIDLILADRGEIVFVEVRSRGSASFGGAAASVGAFKQARIQRAAQHYLLRRFGQRAWPACRFDVVAIDGGRIDWIRGAF